MLNQGNPKTSIIIPTYNGKHLLKDCLDSLRKQTDQDFEVIVVDNGSTDGTIYFLREQYPKAKIVNLKQKSGFAIPVNAGIMASKGQYIAMINNDVVLDSHFLEILTNKLDQRKEIGFAACLMLNKDGIKVDSAGDGFSFWGRAYPIGHGDDPNNYQEEKLVFGASGGASIWRKELLDNVGLLDKDFYAYFEDVDLSFRAQLAGYQCLYVPKAIAYHLGSASFKRDSFKMRLIGNRNKDWVILKNYPLRYLITQSPKLILTKLKSCFTDLKQGLIFAHLGANFAMFFSLPKILPKRWQIQKKRTVSNKYLKSIINPSHPKLS